MFTIISTPLIPLRSEAKEQSEMISQLLFGEQIEILEEQKRWFFVKNLSDGYEGWISANNVHKEHFTVEKTDTTDFQIIHTALLPCTILSKEEDIWLAGGSLIPKTKEERFELFGETYEVKDIGKSTKSIVQLANQYINAPYLWGGKNILGIDCSGLVQVVFAMYGKQLLRDASQQVKEGKTVDFLSEAIEGDVAFFENDEGKIIHVGILLNNHQIIHASGHVKIENIDSQGIISSSTGEYTHRLRIIKRFVD